MTEGIVDQVKVRVRTHAPKQIWEMEFTHIEEAIGFLEGVKEMVVR